MSKQYDAIILGAGVIGLTSALVLHQRGYKIAIVARDLPQDLTSTEFSSPWAGCNWYPFESDPLSPASIREALTFPYLSDLSQREPDLCQRIPFYSVWDYPKPAREADGWFKDIVGDYETLSSPIPGNKTHGRRFTSFILHAPNYITYLSKTLSSLGIPLIRKTLSGLDEAYSIPGVGGTTLVVNALGLGARWFAGVEDPKVHPARGQTILVRAEKWERVCVMHTEGFYPKPGRQMGCSAYELEPLPEPAYIIPRPGPEPHFILGGTYLRDDANSTPRPETSERILRECKALMRGFHKSSTSTSLGVNSGDEVQVISHNVGLRPARDGGARIELERRTARGREVGVVHAYGFGSAGYQQSWGAAQEVARLVDEYHARTGGKL